MRYLQSPHSLKDGILEEDYAKEEGVKGLEGVLKDQNNLVVNVRWRTSIYVKLSSLKLTLFLGEDVKMSEMVEVSGNLC